MKWVSFGVLILLVFLTSFAEEEGPVLDDRGLYPVGYSKLAQLGEEVTLTVDGSKAFQAVFELMEKRRTSRESGGVLVSLAFATIRLEKEKEITVGADATYYELLFEVASALECQLIERDWGYLIVPIGAEVLPVEAEDEEGWKVLSRYYARGGEPIVLIDISPSSGVVADFLFETFSQHSQYLDQQDAPLLACDEDPGDVRNIAETATSNYLGRWSYLALVEAMCDLHEKKWSYDSGTVSIHSMSER